MRTLIRDATVITLDDEDRILQEADIAIDDDTIVAIGDAPHSFEPTDIVDGANRVALPGFFNAHCHAAMTLERGWAEDLPFDRWLNEKIWVAESALEEEDVYWGAALAFCEMIRAGTVGFADHYFWMNQVARAAKKAGMKAHLAWTQFGTGTEHEVGGVSLDDTIRFVRDWDGAADGRIHCAMGPHSPYMCPPEFLRRSVQAAQELDVGIHIHVAESQEQVDNSLEAYGKTPVARLEQLGVFDAPTIAAHCIVVGEDDLCILAERRVHVAHTPKTYLKLAMGVAPLPAFLENDVNAALGTDGPASNSDLNMLELLRITGLYHKNALGKPEALPRTKLLRLATQAGAQAMGFDQSGVLAPGRPADLIVLDTGGPHWHPRHDLAAGVVYAAHPADVTHVLVNGDFLLRDGELVTLDEERIRFEAERRAFRMVGTPMRQVRTYRG
ncbi:MAG: amidohydrolase [Anaerolineae bacterium]|jgi:5-methylthioadenosine/S-adenosylhomocysteine deaminase